MENTTTIKFFLFLYFLSTHFSAHVKNPKMYFSFFLGRESVNYKHFEVVPMKGGFFWL